ncbi:MAG: hypothetical protein ACRDPE_04570 [Solirubrobacterales bacterium]
MSKRKPAVTVGEYGSTFEYVAGKGWTRNGEPWDGDPPISANLTDLLEETAPDSDFNEVSNLYPGKAPELVRRAPKVKGKVAPAECFELRAAALYRAEYHAKPPQPGDQTLMNMGQIADFRAAVQKAMQRGAIALVDARAELAVLAAMSEVLKLNPRGVVPARIGDEPFKIREPRKSGSKSKRKKNRKRR